MYMQTKTLILYVISRLIALIKNVFKIIRFMYIFILIKIEKIKQDNLN